MKKIFVFINLVFALQACQDVNFKIENSKWKVCEGNPITDILIFDKDHLYVRNDSIFWHQNDSLLGTIYKKEWNEKSDYMYNWLYVKNPLNGKITKYCEQ